MYMCTSMLRTFLLKKYVFTEWKQQKKHFLYENTLISLFKSKTKLKLSVQRKFRVLKLYYYFLSPRVIKFSKQKASRLLTIRSASATKKLRINI